MKKASIPPKLLDLLFEKSVAELTEAELASLLPYFGTVEALTAFSGLQQESTAHFSQDPEPPVEAFAALLDKIEPMAPKTEKAAGFWALRIPFYQAAAVALLFIGISWFLGSYRSQQTSSMGEQFASADTIFQKVWVRDTIFISDAATPDSSPAIQQKLPNPVPSPNHSSSSPNRKRNTPPRKKQEIKAPLTGWNPAQALANTQQDEGKAIAGGNSAYRFLPVERMD